MKKAIKSEKGITMVVLVVTIIILLILTSVGIYSGIRILKLAELNRFTAELKIMQTKVNSMYEMWQNDERINNQEILTIGQDIFNNEQVQEQANIVFTENASGVTSSVGYKYYSLNTIKSLGIEGITQDFFVNIQTRSVISYKGLDFEGNKYYTLNQIPNGLYNVQYNDENETISPEIGNITIEKIREGKWKISIENIIFGGYVQKGKIQYQLLGEDYWRESNDKSFVVTNQGIYIIKIIDNAGNESDSTIKYVGDIDVDEHMKVTISGVLELLNTNQIVIEYKKHSDENWRSDLTENYFVATENVMYDIRFTKNSGEEDILSINVGE